MDTHCPVQLPDEADAHHVWPLGEGGPDVSANLIYLCPSSHRKAHNLWRAYVRQSIHHGGGPPAWDIRRRYSPYIRGIVAEGWGQAAGTRSIPGISVRATEDPP